MGKDLGNRIFNPDAEHIRIDCFIVAHFINSLMHILHAQHDNRLQITSGMSVNECYQRNMQLFTGIAERFKQERAYSIDTQDIKRGIEWFLRSNGTNGL